eukprot:682983-Pyramimonas_sp.AAC.1
MRLRSCTIAVGVMYLVPSIGVSGANASRLRSLAEFVNTLAIPWVLIGGFNMPPGLLQERGLLELARARTIVPGNVTVLCVVGESMIDYVVCSDAVWPYVKVDTDPTSPFRVHACLDTRIDLESLSLPVRARSVAAKFPEAYGPDN